MRILYLSSRINAPDGSSVHGRAFVRSARALGYEVETYPQIRPIKYIQDIAYKDTRTVVQKILQIKIWSTVKSRVRRLGPHAGDFVDFVEGFIETIRYFAAVRSILKTFIPDVLVYRSTLFNFGPHLIRKIYKLPCVAEVNSIKYLEISVASRTGAAARVTRFAEQFAINHSDRVFVVSDSIKDFVDQFYPPDNCSVIPNGVETDVFDPELFDKNELKRELGLENKTVLGYVGSYKSWHGLQISLDLIKELWKSNSNFVLLLIGNGEQYTQIKSRIKAEKLGDYIIQIDYVSHSSVPKYTAVFDYAVMTYPDFEGFYFSPLKMYEYMSMGVPVISTDTGQISSIIRNNETGILVSPPTVENFRSAIESLESAPEQYESISKVSRADAISHHSWLENARLVIAICSKLIGENPNFPQSIEAQE